MVAQVFAPNNNVPIDRHQIAKQLELLDYKPGEKIFLKAFYSSHDPRQNNDKGRKANETSIEAIAKIGERFQIQSENSILNCWRCLRCRNLARFQCACLFHH